MNSSEKVTKFRQNRKKALVYIAGNKCNLCGYNKSIAALQFHHIHPELKEYGLASKGTCHAVEKDLKELQKCILVCANCHREIHNESFYSQQELQKKRIYNEEEAKKLLTDTINKKTKTYKYCKQCGKQLPYGTHSEFCVDCYNLNRRKVKRPSREELKILIRTKSFVQIGKDYNVSDNALRKWCDFYNLPRKKTEIKAYSDEKWQKI